MRCFSGRLFLLGCSLFTVAGCGVQDFEKRMAEKGLTPLKQAAKFDVLSTNRTTLPDTTVSLRMLPTNPPNPVVPVPMTFPGTNFETNAPSTADDIQPAASKINLKLPGIRMRYGEKFKRTNEGKTAAYFCYLAAEPTQDAAKSAEALEASLKEAFPEAKIEWDEWKEGRNFETPMGGSIRWKRVKIPFEFTYEMQGYEPRKLPATFDVYCHEGEGYQVVMAWMVPDELATLVPVETWAPLIAGTLQIGG
jgi:hypothetical protein